ncbi:hypothetical protein CYMTET_19934 [Cymbomonas tetramitiformis]|uniref:Uncharacterized protein n=1 Tax=Cymbomonas tetramitiformis TaxID=36881 RepID=A0AAE0G544_9CHLO|nr:hypothetical protein CYMTET_19934 [Cymbomonas tetramitiformis]
MVVAFVTLGRPGTGVALRGDEVNLDGGSVSFVLRKENERSHRREKRHRMFPQNAACGLVELLRLWEAARGQLTEGECYWKLPGETSTSWSGSMGDAWLKMALLHWECVPPEGGLVFWTQRQNRSEGGSAGNGSADVAQVCFVGGWAERSEPVHCNIDPTATMR